MITTRIPLHQRRPNLPTDLIQYSQRVRTTQQLELLLSFAIDDAMKLVDAEQGHIVLVRNDHSLDHQVSRQRHSWCSDEVSSEVSQTILKETIQHGELTFYPDTFSTPQFRRLANRAEQPVLSIMCVPLTHQSEIIGAIYVGKQSLGPSVFTKDDLYVFKFFGSQIAITIVNAILNQELQQAHNKLSSLDIMKTNLVKLVIHQMQSPVAFLVDRTSMPEIGVDVSCLNQLEQTANQTVNIIDDILLSFQIMSNDIPLKVEKTNLEQLLSYVIKSLSEVVSAQGLEISINVVDRLPSIYVDKRLIKIALTKLLTDIIHHLPERGEINCEAILINDRRVALVMHHPSKSSHVIERKLSFELFDSLETWETDATTMRYEPYRNAPIRLELPIAKGLIEAHNGQLYWRDYKTTQDGLLTSLFHLEFPSSLKSKSLS